MPTPSDFTPTGDIRFIDHYVPALTDGDYKINVSQTLDGTGTFNADQSFSEEQLFTVVGPRFRLPPGDVHERFPAPSSQGVFNLFLPHIVLKKRALPWERTVFSSPSIPWLALLVFQESEILTPNIGSNAAPSDAANPTVSTTITLSQLNTGSNTVTPDVTFAPYEKADTNTCQVIDIAPDTFTAIVPTQDNLPYLTHCREVSIEAKSTSVTIDSPDSQLSGDATQWFSTVISSRFPSLPTDDSPGQRNIVHLVSLEGLTDYIGADASTPGQSFPSGTERVRLVSLASWDYTCLATVGQSFAQLMTNLVDDGNATAESLALRYPARSVGESPTDDEQYAANAIEAGYLARTYATRQGEKTFCWYRGPFAPSLTELFPDTQPPFQVASQAAVYDQHYGVFDHSYSGAFEIGRISALHSGTFGPNLLKWRRSGILKLHKIADGLFLKSDGAALKSETPTLTDVQSLLAAGSQHHPIVERLAAYLSKNAPVGAVDANFSPTGVGDQSSKSQSPPATLASLKAALDTPAVAQALEENMSPEFDSLVAWLARLALLYDIPFQTLVPDDALLPAESIRFFYLDQNWISSLVEGAISIGTQTSQDSAYQQKMTGALLSAVQAAVLKMRTDLLGSTSDPPATATGPVAGMLLRSAVVSGYPGLEVQAYRDLDGDTPSSPLQLLRMDHIGSDVILCLFPETPAWIGINEPKEGLHFGVESDNIIYLRNLSGNDVGYLVGPGNQVTAQPNSNRILDIQTLLPEMKSGLGLTDDLGPADFAVQMVVVPEQMIFQASS